MFKIFFSLLSKDGIAIESPFFMFLTKDITIKCFCEIIHEKIKCIKNLSEIDLNQIKIYKSKNIDFVEKNYVLLSYRSNEDSILTFFKEKSKFFNVMIEIPLFVNILNTKKL